MVWMTEFDNVSGQHPPCFPECWHVSDAMSFEEVRQHNTTPKFPNKPVWDPQSSDSADMEDTMVDFQGHFIHCTATARGKVVINPLSASLQVDAVDVTDDENFGW